MKFDNLRLIANFFARMFFGALNFVLLISLLLLTSLLIAVLTGVSFEMPGRVRDKIEDVLRQNGVQFSAENMIFDMDGELVLKGLKLGFVGAKHELLEFRRAKVKFKILSALFGDFKFSSIDLRGGKVYPFLEGEKSRTPLGDCLDLTVVRGGGLYKLENSNVNIGKFGLILSGELSQKFLKELLADVRRAGSEKSAADRGTVNLKALELWADASKWVGDFQQQLESVKNPILLADLSIDKNARLRVRVTAFAEQIKREIGGRELDLRDLRLFALYDSERSLDSFRFSAVSNSVATDFGLGAGHAAVSGVCDFEKMELLDARALLVDADFKGVSAKYLGLSKQRLSKVNYAGDWVLNAKIGEGFILADTDGNFENFKFKFESELDCAELLKCSLIPKLKELEMFRFSAPVMASGAGQIAFGKDLFFDVSADICALKSVFFGVDTESVRGNLSYNSESGDFWARNVKVDSAEGWQVDGDVYQNLKNNDYRFSIAGSLRPMAIAHFMEKWWTEVFSDFSFSRGHFPHADISVSGRWGAPEYIYVFGHVEAGGGIRNGVEFERASLDVWVNPSHIAILNLYAANGDRFLRGALDWPYPEHKLTRYSVNKVFAESTLNRRELIAMGGERVREVVKMLDFSEPPTLKLKLFMPNPALGGDLRDRANLDYFSPGLTRAGKFDLQNLKFSAYALGDDIEIFGAKFGFASGEGDGELKLSKVGGRDWFSADINLSNVNQYGFVETLLPLSDSQDGAATAKGAGGAEGAWGADADEGAKGAQGAAGAYVAKGVKGAENLGSAASPGSSVSAEAALRAEDFEVIESSKGLEAAGGARAEPKPIEQSYKKGRVWGSAKIEGFMDSAESLKGGGKVRLANDDLAEIHILGAISRMADSMHIPLGSFDMRSLVSDFELSDGTLSFPNLKILGDTAIITGNAKYDFMDDNLTAKAIFAPFAAVDVPIFSQIMSITDPLLSVVQIGLSGSFEDPKVSLSLKPLNIFKNESKILKDMGRHIEREIESENKKKSGGGD